MPTGEQRVRKLQWRCRRGMKELDLLLERFLASEHESLLRGDWPVLETLLGEEDDRLWDWLQGRINPADEAYRVLVEKIRVGA